MSPYLAVKIANAEVEKVPQGLIIVTFFSVPFPTPRVERLLLNIDLHVHTNASDGTLSPSQVVKESADAGLRVIAIADHDTTDGISEALEAQDRYGIVVIPGVEVSASDPMGEVHILGYWMDYEDAAFRAFLNKPCSARPDRIAEMCETLTGLGLPIEPAEVFALAGQSGSVGRAHLARVMLEKGYVGNMDEAFDRYLSNGAPAYVKRFKNSTGETISMIHECGGISVLAHPGLIHNPELITRLIEQGVKGIEVFCHDHDPQQTEAFSRMAQEHGLLITGGSDYHGAMLEKTFKLGDLKVPYSCYEKLKEARDRIRSIRENPP